MVDLLKTRGTQFQNKDPPQLKHNKFFATIKANDVEFRVYMPINIANSVLLIY